MHQKETKSSLIAEDQHKKSKQKRRKGKDTRNRERERESTMEKMIEIKHIQIMIARTPNKNKDIEGKPREKMIEISK